MEQPDTNPPGDNLDPEHVESSGRRRFDSDLDRAAGQAARDAARDRDFEQRDERRRARELRAGQPEPVSTTVGWYDFEVRHEVDGPARRPTRRLRLLAGNAEIAKARALREIDDDERARIVEG